MWSRNIFFMLLVLCVIAALVAEAKRDVEERKAMKDKRKDMKAKMKAKKYKKWKKAERFDHDDDDDGHRISDEKRVLRYLKEKYDRVGRDGRPVTNSSATLSVNFGVALIKLLEIDEEKQTIAIDVWERFSWTDEYLTWNPEDFGGVTDVRIPAEYIWTPDIVLFNRVGTNKQQKADALVVIYSNGNVLWIPPSILTASCAMDTSGYPRDTQTCTFKFGSWTYDGFKQDLTFYNGEEKMDANDYSQSQQWELVKNEAVRNVKHYPCCAEPYIDLSFTLSFKRIGIFEDHKWKPVN